MGLPDLVIRRATPHDTDGILDLMKVSLGKGKIPRHRDYWRWKHVDNPFGPSPCLLAEAEGRLVGLRVFMRWNWRLGASLVPAVRAVDTATHPDWRGRGIFSRLTLALVEQLKGEGVRFVFNTPNHQSRPGYLKMGWVSVGRTSLWVRALRPLKIIGSLLPSRRSSLPPKVRAPDSAPGRPVTELLREPGLTPLLRSLRYGPQRFSTPRDSAYIRWRYESIPGFEYRAAWALEGSDGAAIIFRFENRGGLRELRFCEVLIGPTESSVQLGRTLVRSLGDTADADYASAMAAPGTQEQRVLMRSRFFPVPRLGPVMTVRDVIPAEPGLEHKRRSSWQLSIGDLELL